MIISHVIVFLVLLIFVCIGTCCIGKRQQSIQKKSIDYRKCADTQYLIQDEYMISCVEKFDYKTTMLSPIYNNAWVKKVSQKIEDQLSHSDFLNYIYSDVKSCLYIISKHIVNKYFCIDFVKSFPESDLIYLYAIEEFWECYEKSNYGKQKNKKFELPNISMSNVLFDLE